VADRWGEIWVNLKLVKKPPSCLEFIVAHELLYLIERHHNDRDADKSAHLLPR
jgi:predicted metal-dependent hydrolase